jgi:hypothetical protein
MATIKKLAKKKHRNRVIYQSEAVYYCHDATGHHYHDYSAWETYPKDYPWEELPQSVIDLANSSPESLRTIDGTGHIVHHQGTGSWLSGHRNIDFFEYAGNKVRQLKRIQSATYGFEKKHMDVFQFGQAARIDRIELVEPVVNFQASYYLSDGQNEHIMGLKLGDDHANCVWDQELITDGGNIFIMTGPEGEDVNLQPNIEYNFQGEENGSNRTVIGIGNCFLTDYTAQGEVGKPATATFTMQGTNIKADMSFDQVTVPSVNLLSPTLLPETPYTPPIANLEIVRNDPFLAFFDAYPDGEVSTTGGTYYFGEEVKLNATGSYDPNGVIQSYIWDFNSYDMGSRSDRYAGVNTTAFMPLGKKVDGYDGVVFNTPLTLDLRDNHYSTANTTVPITLIAKPLMDPDAFFWEVGVFDSQGLLALIPPSVSSVVEIFDAGGDIEERVIL